MLNFWKKKGNSPLNLEHEVKSFIISIINIINVIYVTMADWKESQKKEVGKKFTFNKAYVDPKTIKGQIAKVVIVENGKEEVFGEK